MEEGENRGGEGEERNKRVGREEQSKYCIVMCMDLTVSIESKNLGEEKERLLSDYLDGNSNWKSQAENEYLISLLLGIYIVYYLSILYHKSGNHFSLIQIESN